MYRYLPRSLVSHGRSFGLWTPLVSRQFPQSSFSFSLHRVWNFFFWLAEGCTNSTAYLLLCPLRCACFVCLCVLLALSPRGTLLFLVVFLAVLVFRSVPGPRSSILAHPHRIRIRILHTHLSISISRSIMHARTNQPSSHPSCHLASSRVPSSYHTQYLLLPLLTPPHPHTHTMIPRRTLHRYYPRPQPV